MFIEDSGMLKVFKISRGISTIHHKIGSPRLEFYGI
jgi:hypothetical protein